MENRRCPCLEPFRAITAHRHFGHISPSSLSGGSVFHGLLSSIVHRGQEEGNAGSS